MESFPLDNHPDFINSILDIIHSSVLILTEDERIGFANRRASAMFDRPPENLLKKNIRDLFMPEDREVLVHNILALTRREGEFEGEAMLQRGMSAAFIGLISSSYLDWEGKQSIVLTIHDITHFKSLERMLKQSERISFIGQILDDINHQIRNPVSVIGGLARRLGNQETPDPRYIDTIASESLRLEKILETLNFFMAQPRPHPVPVKLEQLLLATRERFENLVRESGCVLQCIIAPELRGKTVSVDLGLLLEAFNACIRNACESYADSVPHEERLVILEVIATDQPVLPYGLRISDYGRGMQPEDVAKAFSHFFTRKTHHTGMGLTFAERIMLEQGGRIELNSKPQGGTSVTFCFVHERRRPVRIQKINHEHSM